jgi:tetratricopeptide (TPR) repeat protein
MALFESRPTLILSVVFLSLGCGGPSSIWGDPSKDPPKKPLPSQFQSKCDAAKRQLKPLVVEWPSTDRASLEAATKHGQVVVHYEGCTLDVLRSCTAPEQYKYAYAAITPKDERVSLKSADELYASIPVHAVNFEGKLADYGELTVQMKIVGLWESPPTPPALDELKGDCSQATHVIQALTVGSFEFFAGNASSVDVHAKVLGVKAGGDRARGNESLSRDGEPTKCATSARGDTLPPYGCAALLRLELARIRPNGADLPTCKSNEKLVNRECKPIEKPLELAPEDIGFVDTKGGVDWGNKCYAHYKNGAFAFARAACEEAIKMNPEPNTKGAILFNRGLLEEASGDLKAACEAYRQALVVRPGNKPVTDKFEKLECRKRLSQE